MLATPTMPTRASTWPLDPGQRCRVENTADDRLVLTMLPASLLTDPRVREAHARAQFNQWRASQSRDSESMVFDWPPIIAIHPFQELSKSLHVEADSQLSEPGSPLPPEGQSTPPQQRSSAEASETLQYVGSALATPTTMRLVNCNLCLSDGTSTPSSQSVISLTSDFRYRPGLYVRAGTPVHVPWMRPVPDDAASDRARMSSQTSGGNASINSTPHVSFVPAGASDQGSIKHFPSYILWSQRDEAMRAYRTLGQHDPEHQDPPGDRKRRLSSSSNIGQDVPCPSCSKRLKIELENKGPKDGSSASRQESPSA